MEFKNRVDFLKLMELVNKLPEHCLKAMIESMADTIKYHLHCLKLFDKCIYCNKELPTNEHQIFWNEMKKDYQLGKTRKTKQIKLL